FNVRRSPCPNALGGGAPGAGTGRGGPRQQIADLFGVSAAWIRRLLQRRRQTGSFAARPRGGSPPRKMDPQRCGRLVVLVAQQPDATLEELRDPLAAPVPVRTIARPPARRGLAGKNSAPRAAAHARPDVRRKRARWRGRTRDIDPDRYVFVDEVGASTGLTRLRGRAPAGERLYEGVPQAHWRMTTLIAA